MLDLDRRGIPGAMIATTAFEQAYDAQADVLGFAPGVVYVPHPIQNRTEAELRQIADDSVGPIIASITA
jgi:hypothetical protein